MADALKVLGQQMPAAQTLTTLYTVPGATSTTVSSVVVCNQGPVAGAFRLSVAIAGAADAQQQYIYRDLPIAAADTFVATLGLTLAATDVVRCYSANGTSSFNLFGVEVT